jgi:hypothetical protein
MFDWNHLPEAGGINDQNPFVMEAFRIIKIVEAEVEEEKEKREKVNTRGGYSRPPRRR